MNTPLFENEKIQFNNSQQLILRAANELVVRIGYRAVTMSGLADCAGISRATLYRYYPTKEQLFSDASLLWVFSFVGSLHKVPVAPTVGERVISVIHQAFNIIEDNPKLVTAYIETITTDSSANSSLVNCLHAHIKESIKLRLGSHPLVNSALVESALCHLVISNMIWINTGKTTVSTATGEVTCVAKMLLNDIWEYE